ncbi:MAG: hypothetical protein P8168_05750 [Deltaproteobacteria bacterium]|jgi:hypothetical protein
MEIYVPTTLLDEVTKELTQEGVAFEVTGKKFSTQVEGKPSYEVSEVKTKLVETDVPTVLESASQTRRAYRLPSGKKFLLTDLNDNFEKLVEAPTGWER